MVAEPFTLILTVFIVIIDEFVKKPICRPLQKQQKYTEDVHTSVNQIEFDSFEGSLNRHNFRQRVEKYTYSEHEVDNYEKIENIFPPMCFYKCDYHRDHLTNHEPASTLGKDICTPI